MTIHLTLVTGPMFAGKTSFLIHTIQSTMASTIILATHKDDIRFSKGQELINHDGKVLKHPIHRVETLKELPDIPKDEHVLLAIDEAQFFPDIVPYVRGFWDAGYSNLEVVVCGLNGDFQQKPFGVEPHWISKLICIASECKYLKARCWKTGGEATFSIRKPECKGDSVVVIGGEDLYTAASRKHVTLEE